MADSRPLDFEKVEEIFDYWVEALVKHHGDKTVAAVLSSPAIQAAFVGEIHQFALMED